MDFGIARAGDAGLSQTATVLGTAHYVSPEQAQGKELTGASDMYSLGVVLYEAVTGKLPFDGQDAVSVAVKQVNELPAPPRTVNPDVDPVLEAIIMKALEKDPARRFKDASEMRRVLNDYLAGRPINLGEDISGLQTQVMGGVAPIQNGTAVMSPVEGGVGATQQMGGPRTFSAPGEEEAAKKKKRNVIIGVVVALLAIIAIAGAALSMGGSDKTTVPDVTDKPIAEARATLEQAGFKVGTETEVYSSTVETGNVVGTDPKAGEQADKGSTVKITVSKGTEQVTVPDLKGLTPDAAKKALSDAGLNPAEGDSVYSEDVDAGMVASQDIAAGATANKGDTITYHVSKGEEEVTIPNVEGMTEDQAVSKLENAGFSVTKTSKESDTVDKGSVISQSKTGKAPKGTTITLTVSSGAASITVPNVTGMTQAKAQDALSEVGLRYDVQEQASTQAKGTVVKYSPAGTAKKGDTITIYVSTGSTSTDKSTTN